MQAHSQALTDAARELTDQGRQDVVSVIQASLVATNFAIEKIISSPYVRAQQTACLAQKTLAFDKEIEIVDCLMPDADPHAVLQMLDVQKAQSLLLVSHQPLVSDLLSLLTQGHLQANIHMATATLAYITVASSVALGCGELQWLKHA